MLCWKPSVRAGIDLRALTERPSTTPLPKNRYHVHAMHDRLRWAP